MLLLCLLALLPFVCANSSSLRNRAFCAVSHEGDRARCAVVCLSYIMFSSLFSLVAPKHNETRELCERVCCVWVDAVRRPKPPGKLRSMIDEGNCFLHSSAVTVRHCRASPPFPAAQGAGATVGPIGDALHGPADAFFRHGGE